MERKPRLVWVQAMSLRVEVGAGDNPKPGYVHCDVRPNLPHIEHTCNAWELPFADGTVDEIYTYHMLEHVTEHQGKLSIREWFRVLQSGARVEIHVPDLDGHVRQYFLPGNTTVSGHAHLTNRRHALHGFWGWQNYPEDIHKWGYNFESLSELLAGAGFHRVKRLENVNPLLLDVEAFKP